VWEATARKVGNVHPGASFADLTYSDFIHSAVALSAAWTECQSHVSVGELVLQGIAATQHAVGKNTNLGIVLLLAPLVLAAERGVTVDAILNTTTLPDTERVYEAIRLAKPGGLGQVATADVHTKPTITLFDAMQLAEQHDLIAKQYTHAFAEVRTATESLMTVAQEADSIEAAILSTQLQLLATHGDSLITRKCGAAINAAVQAMAQGVLSVGGIMTQSGRKRARELDAYLRADGHRRNPGTTADMLAACLFIALQEHRLLGDESFHWTVPDWL
jgi:triphosphoribosyl-dephospho-CoA synthase